MQITPISNSSYSQACSFKGKNLDSLSKVIPDTKACKGLTGWHKNSFKQYLAALPTAIVFSKAELDELDKCEIEEYPEKYIKMFCDKKDIPEELRPNVFPRGLPKTFLLGYAPDNNLVLVNNNLDIPKILLFSCLRHEMLHFEQYLKIEQHETYGPQLNDFHAETCTKKLREGFAAMLMTKPEEEWNALNENELDILRNCKKSLEKDYNEGLEACGNYIREVYKKVFSDRRDLIIENMGEIKSGTDEDKKIKSLFDSFIDAEKYNKEDGTLDYKLYYSNPNEFDAFAAGHLAIAQKENRCFMELMRDIIENNLDLVSSEQKEALEEILEENPKAKIFI